jgi:hypothetical protein
MSYISERLLEIERSTVSSRQKMNQRRKEAAQVSLQEADCCDLCGGTNKQKKDGSKKRLALDHCHITGAFRGWLCHKCNLGIGLLGDNPKALQRALDYLTRTPKRRGFYVSTINDRAQVIGLLDTPRDEPSRRVEQMLDALSRTERS